MLKVKEESKKVGLKLNIQKTKIMASDPITSWQIDRETMETVRDFIFLVSKITADGDCSHKIKRHLLLGRNAMTIPEHAPSLVHRVGDTIQPSHPLLSPSPLALNLSQNQGLFQ